MNTRAWRVELELNPDHPDPVGTAAREALAARGLELAGTVRSARAFLLPGALTRNDVERITSDLLADPVTETARILEPGAVPEQAEKMLVIRRKAGVFDPEGSSAARALQFLDVPVDADAAIESYRMFRVTDSVDPQQFLAVGGRALSNPTVETAVLATEPLAPHRSPTPRPCSRVEVPLEGLSDEALLAVSRDGCLALSLDEMKSIREHFAAEGRPPTDAELETLAQTWSEHCKHKTLTGPVHFVEHDRNGKVVRERKFQNLLKETVFAATQRLSPDWCWSVFKDNAGVVALTDDLGIAIKVETHNHPSALEPYGGAGTGIGGVIRDILGTGLGARPIACTDVFCVGPADTDRDALPPGTMHPDRILRGVISGVRDYGNRMGIPTVSGTVLRHPGYIGNPLVFAGCIGEIPREFVEKEVRPGDIIVSVGGRTGRDGIHGATFSSEALHEESESVDAAAVQIGDPITEKKALDVLIQARDRRLYRGITDCGAGGFSSAVGEMGEECGAEVELSKPPLKYAGLTYAEIWISEAQERMVLAVPPEKLDELLALCESEEVEATPFGKFTDTGRLVLRWHDEVVADMGMEFLHGGVPQPERAATDTSPTSEPTAWPDATDLGALLTGVLAHPSVASKEWVVRQYDHEVQGGTVLKPYQGAQGRGPGDGTVVKPVLDAPEGVAIGCGIAPQIGLIDAYAGTACAIDEAIRNVVAAGGNPHRVAILDNFCWGDCRKPDRLGSLVRAAEACYDAAIAYGAPFISGKDSLNNEYRVGGEEHPIPPTLLCTAIAPLADADRSIGTPLQAAGNALILVGATEAAGGGSVAAELLGLADSQAPRPVFESAPAVFDALHTAMQAEEVAACHDLSEGGLAVAAAEMAWGSTAFGASLDVAAVPSSAQLGDTALLFSETPTRFLVEVPPAQVDSFLARFRALHAAVVGQVTNTRKLEVTRAGNSILTADLDDLGTALQGGAL